MVTQKMSALQPGLHRRGHRKHKGGRWEGGREGVWETGCHKCLAKFEQQEDC